MLFVGYRWTDSKKLSASWTCLGVLHLCRVSQARCCSSVPETLWYYRDDQGRELDFIRMHQGQLDLFEVKWSEAPDQKWFDRLLEVKEILKNSKTQKIGDSLCFAAALIPTPGVRSAACMLLIFFKV